MSPAGEKQDNVWPLPKFSFSVDIAGVGNIPFQEVSGLNTDTQDIEYRSGDSKMSSTIKLPGLIGNGNVTCRKGIVANDNRFWDWFTQIKMNTIKRRTVTITLMDERARPTKVWKLSNAYPTKVTGTDLIADGNEVAIEALEFAHEGLTLANS